MSDHLSARTRWAVVMTFAIAMAWLEAASVFYIRTLVGRIEPYQANPLPINGPLGEVEVWREAATLVMIATLGLLAGRTWRHRAGYAAMVFGTWDIFYYVFLHVISGWPRTLVDWDVLFLLPLPWWGPVIAPVSIAVVLIIWGTLATQAGERRADARWARALASIRAHAGARDLHGRCVAGAAERSRRGPAGVADVVRLAAVLGGLAADRATSASSGDEKVSTC